MPPVESPELSDARLEFAFNRQPDGARVDNLVLAARLVERAHLFPVSTDGTDLML